MKKLLGVLTIFLLLTSCNQSKIGYANVEEILKEYKGSKQAEIEMKAESQKISAEIDQITREFQQKVQIYQSATNLSASAKKEQEQVLMQESQMIQQRQQMAQQQVQETGQAKMDKINEEIDSFLASYAKKNGFDFILGTSDLTKSVLYGDESLDVTDELLSALNDNYSSDKEEVKEQEETKEEAVN